MARWLIEVIAEVDRQYEELPDWKKSPGEYGEESTIREPKSDAR